MVDKKGHLPYAGCEKGGLLGHFAKLESAYTEEDLIKLGQEMLDWFFENPMEIWLKDFFIYRGLKKRHVDELKNRYPVFNEYYEHAKELQESRLLKYPFWKKADGAHARFMLARHHEGYKEVDQEQAITVAKSASQFLNDLIRKKDNNNVG